MRGGAAAPPGRGAAQVQAGGVRPRGRVGAGARPRARPGALGHSTVPAILRHHVTAVPFHGCHDDCGRSPLRYRGKAVRQ